MGRTTVTLDPDVERQLKLHMRERGLTFKAAVNHAIRAGLSPARGTEPFRTQTFSMGNREGIDLDKALQIGADDEDAELIRRMNLRK